MRRLIAALIILSLLLPLPASATSPPGYPWRVQTVKVYDHTSDLWNGYVQYAVDEANTLIPGHTNFVYVDKPAADCDSLMVKIDAVVVCSQSEFVWYAGFAEWQYYQVKIAKRQWKNVMYYSKVALADVHFVDWRGIHQEASVCHEVIMHGILGVIHPNGVYNYLTPEQSCVHNWAPKPGTWDQQAANDAYGVTSPPRATSHKGAGKKRGDLRVHRVYDAPAGSHR